VKQGVYTTGAIAIRSRCSWKIMRVNLRSEFYQAAKSEQSDAERGRTDGFVLTRVYLARIVRPL
jgi:hypothetical protein